MKLLAATALAVLATLSAPAVALSHPLGNFTVNRYAGIEIAGSDVYVRYVLDLAEIPTFQLGAEVRKPTFPVRFARSLELRLDGRRLPLRMVDRRWTSRQGAGGLETLRLEAVYRALGSGRDLAFLDTSFPGRIGWREMTIAARDGARILESSVPAVSESRALQAYPDDLLRSPLDVSSARASLELGDAPGAPPRIGAPAAAGAARGGFEELIEERELTLGVLLLSLLVAAFWGAAHALTPGHGKALVAAYLVGTRGTPRHAFLLGGTVTVAHTAGVFALGVVALALSQLVLPEQLYPWLTFVSGLLVVAVGLAVLRARLRARGHHHHHDHHAHAGPEAAAPRGILGVGIAAGLLPCPSALVVLLSAIALHRIALGFALIVAFSLGLAVTITAIGLMAVLAQRTFGRLSLNGPVFRSLPAASASLVLVVGLVITARALPGVL